jgi:recombinational DNA repair protein RecR
VWKQEVVMFEFLCIFLEPLKHIFLRELKKFSTNYHVIKNKNSKIYSPEAMSHCQ